MVSCRDIKVDKRTRARARVSLARGPELVWHARLGNAQPTELEGVELFNIHTPWLAEDRDMLAGTAVPLQPAGWTPR